MMILCIAVSSCGSSCTIDCQAYPAFACGSNHSYSYLSLSWTVVLFLFDFFLSNLSCFDDNNSMQLFRGPEDLTDDRQTKEEFSRDGVRQGGSEQLFLINHANKHKQQECIRGCKFFTTVAQISRGKLGTVDTR